MPDQRLWPTITTLPSGELFAAGGMSTSDEDDDHKKVFIYRYHQLIIPFSVRIILRDMIIGITISNSTILLYCFVCYCAIERCGHYLVIFSLTLLLLVLLIIISTNNAL